MKKIRKSITSFLLIALITFFLFEIVLRIYHPFPFTIKRDKIVLSSNRDLYFQPKKKTQKLDTLIHHRKNKHGFRGPDLPKDPELYLKIIAVGGSTTACRFLSEGKDWPALLGKKLTESIPQIWINNAGFSGHSTRAHQLLLEDYLGELAPDYVLFLVGINDLYYQGNLDEQEKMMMRSYVGGLAGFLARNSEVISLFSNLWRANRAQKYGLTHQIIDFSSLDNLNFSKKAESIKTNFLQQKSLHDYKERLNKLILSSRKKHLEPILLTQASLFASTEDSLNIQGPYLSHLKMPWKIEGEEVDGNLMWELLEEFNQATKEIGAKNEVLTIDVDSLMPKDTLLYHDFIHYSNAGAEVLAELLAEELLPFLNKNKKSMNEN